MNTAVHRSVLSAGARRLGSYTKRVSLDPTTLTLVGLLVIWLAWAPRSPDLAAQVYRVHLFSREGFSLWDENWYDGHYLPAYSLLFPPLAAFVGLHWAGVAAVSASTLIFARLARSRFKERGRLASTLFALGAVGDLFIGRITYAAGVSFALAAVLALTHRRLGWTALLSLVCSACSPVAGAFLVLAATADLIDSRSLSRAAALGGPALALICVLGILFPEGGYETFALTSLLAASGLSLAVLVLLPARERLLRSGTVLYLLALLLSYFVPSPMGSNIVRLGVLLAPAILAGAVDVQDVRDALSRLLRPSTHASRGPLAGTRMPGPRLARAVLGVLGITLVAWQVNGPIAQSVQASTEPSTELGYYRPVIGYLRRQSASGPFRIEVPFSRSHWDAVILGRRFALARGWERQLDTRYDALFYGSPLSASAYHAWLAQTAVRFVVLSDAPLDFSSVAEGELIRGGLPFLRKVFHAKHWTVYEVRGARALASGPGKLMAMSDGGFTLIARHRGSFLVRIHYTPYWHLAASAGSVSRAPGGWTEVTLARAGTVTIAAEL